MNGADLGYMFGGFAVAIAIGYVTLGLLWLIPAVRRRRRAWYMTASIITFLFGFVSISGYTLGHAIGVVVFTAMAVWRSRPTNGKTKPQT